MADVNDIEQSDSQDISEIRRKALALLERCGGNSDEEIDYNEEDEEEDFEDEETMDSPEMKNIRSSELVKKSPSPLHKIEANDEELGGASPTRRRRGKPKVEDTVSTGSMDTDDDQSYGDEELDPLVKAVRELSYSLETDMVERQESTLTEDGGDGMGNICCCCNCCCCRRWSRRTQCLVVWILAILMFAVSYYLFLTQYPHWKAKTTTT
mmetsp:Transcript_45149/g.109243  ORF Transcript_45149/g.109243 Transcript_45149/m.109243 type:complete len:210 (+) Transcript_45149:196-825(+)